jgi:hypothetical protein
VHLGDRTPDSMRSYEWKYYNFTIPVAEQDMAIIFKRTIRLSTSIRVARLLTLAVALY